MNITSARSIARIAGPDLILQGDLDLLPTH